MSLFRGSHRVSQFSWLLLGFGLYSYRVREILIGWLFFSGMFAVLGLLATGGILAWHGGKSMLDWTLRSYGWHSKLVSIQGKVPLRPVADGRIWK